MESVHPLDGPRSTDQAIPLRPTELLLLHELVASPRRYQNDRSRHRSVPDGGEHRPQSSTPGLPRAGPETDLQRPPRRRNQTQGSRRSKSTLGRDKSTGHKANDFQRIRCWRESLRDHW